MENSFFNTGGGGGPGGSIGDDDKRQEANDKMCVWEGWSQEVRGKSGVNTEGRGAVKGEYDGLGKGCERCNQYATKGSLLFAYDGIVFAGEGNDHHNKFVGPLVE